jgi:large subunit ribosomal protein L21
MTFAVIEAGGKQYKISEGDYVTLEKIVGEYKEGDSLTFDKVLLLDDGTTTKIGTPYLEGVTVEAAFVEEGKGKKIHVRKFKSKSRYTRQYGHRQPFTKVKVSASK